jgi:hypothetical protein
LPPPNGLQADSTSAATSKAANKEESLNLLLICLPPSEGLQYIGKANNSLEPERNQNLKKNSPSYICKS